MSGILLTLAFLNTPPLEDDLVFVPWDQWSMLDHRLANRRLPEQLGEQPHRVYAGSAPLTLAIDGQTGTQMPRHGTRVARWHGHFLADAFLAGRLTPNIDLNLNLSLYTLSASNGYRSVAGVLPGFAAHLHGPLGGSGIEGDLVALDLGAFTLGHGLLLENVYLEGAMARLRAGEVSWLVLIGGQIHGPRDDGFITALSWRGARLSWFGWPQFGFETFPQYLSLALEAPGLGESLRLALEGAARLPNADGGWAGAALARTDWMAELPFGGELHLGYQFRYYTQGIAPSGDALFAGSDAPAFLWREDTYFTNAYEAWWPSAYYDQWWHTGMLETLVPIASWIGLRTEVEAVFQFYDDPESPVRSLPVAHPDFESGEGVLPDPQLRVLYRAGVEAWPAPGLPHRIRVWVVNKAADSSFTPRAPTPVRFAERGWLIAFELELFL